MKDEGFGRENEQSPTSLGSSLLSLGERLEKWADTETCLTHGQIRRVVAEEAFAGAVVLGIAAVCSLRPESVRLFGDGMPQFLKIGLKKLFDALSPNNDVFFQRGSYNLQGVDIKASGSSSFRQIMDWLSNHKESLNLEVHPYTIRATVNVVQVGENMAIGARDGFIHFPKLPDEAGREMLDQIRKLSQLKCEQFAVRGLGAIGCLTGAWKALNLPRQDGNNNSDRVKRSNLVVPLAAFVTRGMAKWLESDGNE